MAENRIADLTLDEATLLKRSEDVEQERAASPQEIETLDMARRAIHDRGTRQLLEALEGKVETDFATARRLFTLICVLHIRT